jgi:hypothetical protein
MERADKKMNNNNLFLNKKLLNKSYLSYDIAVIEGNLAVNLGSRGRRG